MYLIAKVDTSLFVFYPVFFWDWAQSLLLSVVAILGLASSLGFNKLKPQ